MDTACLLLAVFFSCLALGNAGRFHPDEAYYMTSARHAAVNGDWWFLAEPIDKPPLTYYANALALVFLAVQANEDGVLQLDSLQGEFAGRLSSLLASVLLVAVVMQVARAASGYVQAGWIAGLLVALSPLRIAFAATAFTDMPMLLAGTLALWMAVRGKAMWAGIWFAIALAAKPQIIFYVPLLLILLLAQNNTRIRQVILCVLPVVVCIVVLALWDTARIAQGVDGFYALGQSRYTPTTFTPFADYPSRLSVWWETAQYLAGHALITGVGWVLIAWRMREHLSGGISSLGWFFLWSAGFAGIHVVLTLNLFDRNQLVLLPIFAVLCADALAHLFSRLQTQQQVIIAITISVLLSIFSWQAARGNLPIGGDDGRHNRIDELAHYLNQKPVATVVYDRWLDWELDYYMGQWTDKRRVYYPTPETLANGARDLDEIGTRYFIVPDWEDETLWLEALSSAGFGIAVDTQIGHFTVYRLNPPQ